MILPSFSFLVRHFMHISNLIKSENSERYFTAISKQFSKEHLKSLIIFENKSGSKSY